MWSLLIYRDRSVNKPPSWIKTTHLKRHEKINYKNTLDSYTAACIRSNKLTTKIIRKYTCRRHFTLMEEPNHKGQEKRGRPRVQILPWHTEQPSDLQQREVSGTIKPDYMVNLILLCNAYLLSQIFIIQKPSIFYTRMPVPI